MPIYRIFDANFNRAREAARVMEEAARFVLNDKTLAEQIKQLRHSISQQASTIPELSRHRNTPGDVGTTITTSTEQTRTSISQVAIAASKRLSEALRSIEEYGKTLPTATPANIPSLSQVIEQLRYQGYTLEQALEEKLKPYDVQQWPLCVLITQSLCQLPWQEVLKQTIDAGCTCIQIREKNMDAGDLYEHTKDVLSQLPQHVTLIVNDRPDVALAAGAHGVHFGQTDLPISQARKLFGHRLIMGLSTHKLSDAQAAYEHGADYCGIGPVYASTTKPRPFVAGGEYLEQYTNWVTQEKIHLPHLAIGGITLANVTDLKPQGLQGVAVSSLICNSKEPGDITKQLLEHLSRSV